MAGGQRKETVRRRAVRRLAVTCAVGAVAGAGATVAQSYSYSSTHAARLSLGDTFIAHGRTGKRPGATAHTVGLVVVRGSWNGGPWRVVTTTRTDASGHYRFRIKPHRRGRLALLIAPPDKYVKHFTLTVR